MKIMILSAIFIALACVGNAQTNTTVRQTGGGSNCGTPPFEQCSFYDSFSKFDTKNRWMVHNNIYNRSPFDSWWSRAQVKLYPKWGKLGLTVGNKPKFGKSYASSQVLSQKWYTYGCYEIRMKPVSVPGVLSTFFIYTGEYDAAPNRPKVHSEIDIEFVYRTKLGKSVLQSNYFANNKGHNEKFHFPGFDPHDGFHYYGFKFTSKKIEWYADGKLIRTATRNLPKRKDGPFRIFMNVWVADQSAYIWAGKYVHRGKLSVNYDKLRYTRGENCKIGSSF